jgi:capsular polysaccharide transport system ATP-binding protein
MSGLDNVKFVARAYGGDVRKVVEFVEDFAELGDYVNAPVRTYSSGMMARLAFGLSMAIEFDCYLIDEVIAVGDARFQTKCKKAFEARRHNADLIMVSHSMNTIKSLCDRGLVVVDGRLVQFNNVEDAIGMYYRLNR